MATMYKGSGTVTHESDDARPGKALCGRSIVGALNLSTMGPWERMGFDASSSGECQRCSTVKMEMSVHSDPTIARAYRDGWRASQRPGHDLDVAEDRYARNHTAAEQDAFSTGWIDYASDYAYGTGIKPAPTYGDVTFVSVNANTGTRTYVGPAIHDGSPAEHVTAALTAAQDHSVPAVRDYLTRALTTQLARTTARGTRTR